MSMHTVPRRHGRDEPRFEELRVEDVMHVGVLTCPPETPLTTAAQMMARYRVHAIVVTDFDAEGEGEQPWRVAADLDVARAVATGDFEDMSCAGIAATEVVSVTTDEPLYEAARLMSEHEVAHLIVLADRGGAPVGVISTLDLAAALPPHRAE